MIVVVVTIIALLFFIGLPVLALIRAQSTLRRLEQTEKRLRRLEDELVHLRLEARQQRRRRGPRAPLKAPAGPEAGPESIQTTPPSPPPAAEATDRLVAAASPDALPGTDASPADPVSPPPSQPDVPAPPQPAVEAADRLAAAASPDALPGTDAPPADPLSPPPSQPDVPASPSTAPSPRPVVPPRPELSIERLAMWLAAGLGGISVVLATLFALSAAIDRGWVGPSSRVALGLLLGTVAWWSGSLARSRRLPWVGSALVGAGISGIMGTLYAANVLYQLIPSPVTFLLLAAVSGVTLLSGMRRGTRFDAWLGLLGGLATPLMVQATEPRPRVLLGYLLVLVASATVAAARRGWSDLVLGAAVGFSAAFIGWTTTAARPIDQPIALGAVALLVAVYALSSRAAQSPEHPAARTHAGLAAAVLGLMALPWLAPAAPFFVDPLSGLSVPRPAAWGAAEPWLTAAGLLATVAPATLLLPSERLQRLASVVAVLLAGVFGFQQADQSTVPWSAIASGLAGLPLMALWPRARPSSTSAWSHPHLPLMAAAGVGASAALISGEPTSAGVLQLGLSAILPAVAVCALRRRPEHLLAALPGAGLLLGVASGSVELIGPVALAGPAVLGFALFGTLPLILRSPHGDARSTIPAALAGPVFFLPLYTAWSEAAGDALIGALPALIGAVALMGALTLVRQHGAGRDSGPLALFVGVTLLGISAAIPLQVHDQWLTIAWALEAAAVAWASRRLDHPLLRWSAVGLAAAVTIRLTLNPWALEYADASGPLLFNWTLGTWGLPALCLAATAHLLGPANDEDTRPRVPEPVRLGVVLGAVLVGFALINVQVSHAFQDSGPIELGGNGIWQAMVRSLAWAAYGIVILAAGTWRDIRAIRMVGFVVVLAAAGKVFLGDLWSLSGFVRVGSVAGLGVTLLLAAFVFERLVLRRSTPPAGSDS